MGNSFPTPADLLQPAPTESDFARAVAVRVEAMGHTLRQAPSSARGYIIPVPTFRDGVQVTPELIAALHAEFEKAGWVPVYSPLTRAFHLSPR